MIARQLEESPGCIKTRFHLTDGWGNPRDSATESIPLPALLHLDKVVALVRGIVDGLCSSTRRHKGVRVKRWGKSLPVF